MLLPALCVFVTDDKLLLLVISVHKYILGLCLRREHLCQL